MTTIKPYSIVFIIFCCFVGLGSFTWTSQAPPNDSVVGTWNLSQLYPTAKDTFQHKETMQLTIEKDGNTTGFLACNKFRSSCTTYRDSITFGTILSSRKFCHRSVMDLEDKIKAVLSTTNLYSTKDNTLTLYCGKVKLALFKKH
jgi:heat shock protein HslJ